METRTTTGQGAADAFGDLVTACDRSIAAFKSLRSGAVAVQDAAAALSAYCEKAIGGRAAA